MIVAIARSAPIGVIPICVSAARPDWTHDPEAHYPYRVQSKPLLKLADVADMLGTSIPQIRNMGARGQIPRPLKVPGLGLRYPADVIETWLEAQRSRVAA